MSCHVFVLSFKSHLPTQSLVSLYHIFLPLSFHKLVLLSYLLPSFLHDHTILIAVLLLYRINHRLSLSNFFSDSFISNSISSINFLSIYCINVPCAKSQFPFPLWVLSWCWSVLSEATILSLNQFIPLHGGLAQCNVSPNLEGQVICLGFPSPRPAAFTSARSLVCPTGSSSAMYRRTEGLLLRCYYRWDPPLEYFFVWPLPFDLSNKGDPTSSKLLLA